jgi:hypothetical protein
MLSVVFTTKSRNQNTMVSSRAAMVERVTRPSRAHTAKR